VIGTIALIVTIPFAKPLAKRFSKRSIFLTSSLLSGFFFILMFIPGKDNVMAVYILNILAKVAYAPAVPLLWTMLADTADYSEWKTGRRSTGLVFSAATFAQKAGWGIGGALAGWLLYVFQFVPNAVQTETAITGIKLMVSVFPGMLYMSCAIFLYFYNIDSATASRMQAELELRRASEAD
jgi:GPH family glycoside/pentoside/hexuronide:cation symporter